MHLLKNLLTRGCSIVVLLPVAFSICESNAQPRPADYERALGLRDKYKGLVLHLPDAVEWIEGSNRFVYRRSIAGGHEFLLVDAEKQTSQLAFDHARLAATLSKALGEEIKPETLPFDHVHFEASGTAFEFARASQSDSERSIPRY